MLSLLSFLVWLVLRIFEHPLFSLCSLALAPSPLAYALLLILCSAFQFGLRERLCHELAHIASSIPAGPLFFVEAVDVPRLWGGMVTLRSVDPNSGVRFPIRFGTLEGFSHESAHAAISFS
jgi:hypothetical protein